MTKKKLEYGDFQTPVELARDCCKTIQSLGCIPKTIIEPTCGYGNFLLAAAECFGSAKKIYGFDINDEYIAQLKKRISPYLEDRVFPRVGNFFTMKWDSILNTVESPLLIIGNPPWVTSAQLGLLASKNLPEKKNFQKHYGLDALTGKSNFDISEWMLLKQIEWLKGTSGTIAILCKTAVARKILKTEWKKTQSLYNLRMYSIDATREFNSSVDACLFVCESAKTHKNKDCAVFNSLHAKKPKLKIGYRNNYLVSNTEIFDNLKMLFGKDSFYTWRSGLKHDCSSVMKLTQTSSGLINGFGEQVDIESEYIYSLFNSSDVANGNQRKKKCYVIVTQKYIGQETDSIKYKAPKTWNYLQTYKPRLDKRGSKVYKRSPSFSIFGIGLYSFEPWKVAISGFYKHLYFKVIEPENGKPCMVDDTVYFLGCRTEKEAKTLAKWLNSTMCQQFLGSMIFWKDKRPITINLLERLNIRELAKQHDEEALYLQITENRRK